MITPLQAYDVLEIAQGPAILFIGLLALLLWSTIVFRNPLAMMSWGITVLLFTFSGLFGIGFELVWITLSITVILLIIGVTVRWTQ